VGTATRQRPTPGRNARVELAPSQMVLVEHNQREQPDGCERLDTEHRHVCFELLEERRVSVVRLTRGIGREAVPASVRDGACMTRHLRESHASLPCSGAAESFVSFIPLFCGLRACLSV
jgi:hypothetical protein